MAKIIRMTEEEIRKNYNVEKAVAMAKVAPEEKELPFNTGHVVARGFNTFKEHINKKGRSKTEDPKVSVSIRIPRSYVDGLRSTGRGWQTRVSEYLVNGIKRGDLR